MEGGFAPLGKSAIHHPIVQIRAVGRGQGDHLGFNPSMPPVVHGPPDPNEARVFRQEGGGTSPPAFSLFRLRPKHLQSQVNAAPDETSRMATHRLAPTGGCHSLVPWAMRHREGSNATTMHCPIRGRAVLPCSPLSLHCPLRRCRCGFWRRR